MSRFKDCKNDIPRVTEHAYIDAFVMYQNNVNYLLDGINVFHGYTVCTALPIFPFTHILTGKIIPSQNAEISIHATCLFRLFFVFLSVARINKFHCNVFKHDLIEYQTTEQAESSSIILGLVVQSIISLTSLLTGQLVRCISNL